METPGATWHSRSGCSAAPPAETVLQLLGRCLFWERLLKDRLARRLNRPRWAGPVQQALAELGEADGDPEARVQSLTMGDFLRLLSQVLPDDDGRAQWDFRDFSWVRNQAAHGQSITWADHWAKLEASEPLLVRAYATLAE